MKKVAVIQDLSSFGRCSLTAAIPVMSIMGVQVCPLPTAVLSAQTAYDHFFCKDLTDEMEAFTTHWQQLDVTFDGIQTGFVTGEAQVKHMMTFLNSFQQSDTTVLVDPVLGDDGQQYKMFSASLLDHMRALVQRATIITPNMTECCLLTGTDYEKLKRYRDPQSFLQAITEVGHILQQQTNASLIITGVPTVDEGKHYIGNIMLDQHEAVYLKQPFNGKSYSGTGDLFAAVLMGGLMRGDSLKETVQLAERFLYASIAHTTTDPKAGLAFEPHLHLLYSQKRSF